MLSKSNGLLTIPNCNETIEMLSNLISPRPRGSRVRPAGKWIYNYLCIQCYITTKIVSSNFVHGGMYSIQHYVTICQWPATGRRVVFSGRPGTLVSFTNKTDRHDIIEILLNVAWKTITLTPYFSEVSIDTHIWFPLAESTKMSPLLTFVWHTLRVITKLPNSEQSNKGKVKTHKYINRQNQSTIGKLKTVMTLTWYRHFLRNGGLNQIYHMTSFLLMKLPRDNTN
jgi:hypothetical protein